MQVGWNRSTADMSSSIVSAALRNLRNALRFSLRIQRRRLLALLRDVFLQMERRQVRLRRQIS